MRTHIETLADDCPKSRRRVRRTLGWKAGPADGRTSYGSPHSPSVDGIRMAWDEARRREKAGAERDRAKKNGGAS